MTNRDCKNIRQEIDEAIPGGSVSGKVRDHLNTCSECRAFESERRSLQGLIADLGTVTAPADFDFRLRARLARERSGARNGHGFAMWFGIPRPIAIAAMILLLGVVGVLIRNQVRSPNARAQTAGNIPAAPPAPVIEQKSEAGGNLPSSGTGINQVALQPHEDRGPVLLKHNGNGRGGFAAKRTGEKTVTREMALGSATVFGPRQANDYGVIRIPIEDQELRITIDDGRGTPRAVSLPAVSFGSQRLTMTNSFLPAGSAAKRIW